MAFTPRSSRGYSMVEILVVLSILAILSVSGVYIIGNRPSNAVRGLMDEMEGVLASAHKQAVATGRDVTIATTGSWDRSTPLRMAFGDSSLDPDPDKLQAAILANGLASSEAFRYLPGSREHMYAGPVVKGSDWWARAAVGSQGIEDVEPFKSNTNFSGLLSNADSNLFQGSAASVGRISGANKRFTTSFWVGIVGLRNGQPVPGGPMGLLVVLNNGATVYRFYNPGIKSSDGKWRKI